MGKRILFFTLVVLMFRSNLGCVDWEWKGEPWFGQPLEKREVVDVTDYFKQKCEVCGKPFNYTIEIDSNSNIINDKTETYFGRNMHKECYEKLISFLIWEYQSRGEKIINSLNNLNVTGTILIISSSTFYKK